MIVMAISKGYSVLLDDEDYNRLKNYTWNAEVKKRTGLVYASRSLGYGNNWYMHWDVLAPKLGCVTDHINKNTLDNRRRNLRNATRSQSNANTKTKAISGLRGVSLIPRTKPYKAQIKIAGYCIHLGLFSTASEAAKAYDEAAKEAYGEFATLNYP